MTFQELQNIRVGTILRLKGTKVHFEVTDTDPTDRIKPLSVSLVTADKPVFVGYDANWDEMQLVEPEEVTWSTKPEYWILANKTVMREEAELTRSQFENMTKNFHILTMRDLEVVDTIAEREETRGSTLTKPAKPTFAEDVAEFIRSEYGVLPIVAARQFVNDFNSRKVTIQLINAAIARAAQAGKQIINLADVINHQVSEEIKDLYRQAGYHVAFETIQW